MKVKTSELTELALDYAVTKALWGHKPYTTEELIQIAITWQHSSQWVFAGPIIEREGICLIQWGYSWNAHASQGPKAAQRVEGKTPLIAAMRCYVMAKLGDSVDIPDQLVQ